MLHQSLSKARYAVAGKRPNLDHKSTCEHALQSPLLAFDTRWIADHGIGRVAREWWNRARDWQSLGQKPSPASPLDPIWLAHKLHTVKLPFLSPGFNPPLYSRRPFFVTIHDLCYLEQPARSGWLKRPYYGTVVAVGARAAETVFTPSEFSRTRIIELFDVDPDRVSVVPGGVSELFTPGDAETQSASNYFLCVSNGSPHKNECMTVQAFARSKFSNQGYLVMTGNPRILPLAGQKSCRIEFTGHITDNALADLYRHARGLLFVSLYEGFGLPAVEAMASGLPIISSTVTALPEVCGDAAFLVDPRDEIAIAAAIDRVTEDSTLRASLRAAGMRRAKQFTWERGFQLVDAITRARLE